MATGDRAEALRTLLERAVGDDEAVHGGVLDVAMPGFDWSGAAGLADPAHGIAMRPDDPFQIASITKMFTATLMVLLAEDGAVDLDAEIGRYLPATVTRGLHVIGGIDRGGGITPRQLLSHTSGLADFFGDGAPGPGGVLPFVAEMQADPDRLWDPLEILDWTRSNLTAHFPPGEGWHYSDTGMLMAGLIIERVTGIAYHEAVCRRLTEPLGMDDTFMLFREPAPPGLAGRPVTPAHAGVAVYGATPSVSADWACGGLVSTAGDLRRFIRAFADGGILPASEARSRMLSWTATGEPGVVYGLGVRGFDLAALGMAGFGTLWGHTGFVRSFMLYWPAGDATICGTLNQATARGTFSELRPVAALVPEVLGALR